MNKLIPALFAAAVCVGAVTTLNAQSADEQDVAKLTVKLNEYKAANPKDWRIMDTLYKIELAKTPPTSFADMLSAAERAAVGAGITDPVDAKRRSGGAACAFAAWWFKRAYAHDAYVYAKANGINTFSFVVHIPSDLLKISDSERYEQIVACCLKYNLSANQAKVAIEKIVKLGAVKEEATVKADLKKLNRLYSPMLIADKASWEPVVAMIRTALETY